MIHTPQFYAFCRHISKLDLQDVGHTVVAQDKLDYLVAKIAPVRFPIVLFPLESKSFRYNELETPLKRRNCYRDFLKNEKGSLLSEVCENH